MSRDSFARNAVAVYLREMAEVRGYGTAETSRYDPLAKLLNAVGGELKPKVSVVQQLRDIGHGLPDFGFFTEAQIRRGKNRGVADEKPERGVAEIKPLSANIGELLASEQTQKYLRGYGLVLASNYRQFALVENNDGNPKELPRFTLADSEDDFWEKAKHPIKTAAEFGEQLCEFLRRALLHNAPITTAADVAKHLASYARETLALLKNGDEEAMRPLRKDLESMLSMTFDGENSAHFFHSTLAQTIYYGLFSAWLQTKGTFDWEKAAQSVNNPIMGSLFSEIINPQRLGKLGLADPLNGATALLNRVQDKNDLFGGVSAMEAIQHFYEPFVAEFDPELRKEMGVWYTPPEIVRYMVERADRVLRTELNIPDGLADDNVYVLDPCGGTGAYIAETLRRIHKTCKERGDGAGAAQTVKEAAQKRIIGFEIMSAPYLVAHWQVETLLKELGAPLDEDKRAAIYLTNSLTNWTPAEQPPLDIPGFDEERKAANKVKQKSRILVIMGNPPYNAFAGTSPKEEDGLVAPYKEGLAEWGINAGNLNDLYIRFFRTAENRIAKTGRGIVSFISNYSYTEEPLFVVMRQSLLSRFNKIWIENMHGNRNKSERAPDGSASETIFAMRGLSPGIRQGIVIGLFCKTSDSESTPNQVLYRNDLDDAKAENRRARLLASLEEKKAAKFNSRYEKATPQKWNKLSFRPLGVSKDFLRWPSLDSLCVFYSNGLNEGRKGALIDFDHKALEKRMRDYFNPDINWDDYQRMGGGLAQNAPGFNAKAVREKMIDEGFDAQNILSFTAHQFGDGFCYHSNVRPLWVASRPALREQYKPGNSFIATRARDRFSTKGAAVFFTTHLGNRAVMNDTCYIPLYLHPQEESVEMLVSQKQEQRQANLSKQARKYLRGLKFANPDNDVKAAEAIWLHALAVGYAPDYQTENADGLRIGWPRIPLPPNAKTLKQSAALGAKVRNLLDMQTPIDYRTPAGKQLSKLAVVGGDARFLEAADWWGYKDGKGKTYPGVGRLEDDDTAAELPQLGAPQKVCLNEKMWWQNVPAKAWDYRIGGFQPPKKWLSYRARKVLGRPLQESEVRQFADITRRISALLLMEAELNANYRAAKEE